MRELRLGFGNKSFSGAGAGLKRSADIIASLKRSQSLETLLYQDIEDLVLFVPNVGKDVTPDIKGSLIKNQLAIYTQEQCLLFDIPMEKSTRYWLSLVLKISGLEKRICIFTCR